MNLQLSPFTNHNRFVILWLSHRQFDQS